MVEMALAFPILLLVLAGTLEVGKYFNDYLTLLDATREGARFAADQQYSHIVEPLYAPNTNYTLGIGSPATDPYRMCNYDFYRQAACLVFRNIYGFRFDPSVDDVVISTFSVGSDGSIAHRFPRPCSDPAPGAQMYQGCNQLVTSRQQGWSYCQNVILQDIPRPELTEATDSLASYAGTTCNPKTSLFSDEDIEQLLNTSDTPETGLVLVEVYHVHRQFLGLIPPGFPILPQEVMMHAYTIMPNPTAQPIS
jgi:hypothetical protein